MPSEAQRRAAKKYKEKYKEKLKRITIDFYPSETDLWEHLQQQDRKQTYIKDLIRRDIETQKLKNVMAKAGTIHIEKLPTKINGYWGEDKEEA